MKSEFIRNDAASPNGRNEKPKHSVPGRAQSYWPIGIITAFIIFISGTAGLVVLACSQKMDLVSSDYYEQEIKFQNRIDQLARARALGANASVRYEAETGHLQITLPADQARAGVTGSIQLYRPSEARLDRQFKLELDPRGCQRLAAHGLAPGLWKVRVSWSAGTQQFLIEESVVVGGPGKNSKTVTL